MRLKVLTLNIHKGFSSYRRRPILERLREALRESSADLVFLQEVAWRTDKAQCEYLADQVWQEHAYGKNAVYDQGHHGNAILSKYNFQMSMNTDISSSRWERRGFLYASLIVEQRILHLVSLHLSLRAKDRRVQAKTLAKFVESLPADEAIIIGGDFNDWNMDMRVLLEEPLKLTEAYRAIHGSEARTFPSYMPVLRLDRIYTRGVKVHSAKTFADTHWPRLSDHLGILAEIEIC